jgi:hypothetical protein
MPNVVIKEIQNGLVATVNGQEWNIGLVFDCQHFLPDDIKAILRAAILKRMGEGEEEGGYGVPLKIESNELGWYILYEDGTKTPVSFDLFNSVAESRGWIQQDEAEREPYLRRIEMLECDNASKQDMIDNCEAANQLLMDQLAAAQSWEVEAEQLQLDRDELREELAAANKRVEESREELAALRKLHPAKTDTSAIIEETRKRMVAERETEQLKRCLFQAQEAAKEATSRPCTCATGPIERIEELTCIFDDLVAVPSHCKYVVFLKDGKRDYDCFNDAIGFARIRRENLEVKDGQDS